MAQYVDIHSHGVGCCDGQLIRVADTPSALPYALGQHPWQSAMDGVEFSEADLSGALAIGEVGLDYSDPVVKKSPKPRQLSIFREQVELAERLDMPLVIHSIQAQGDTLDILRSASVAWVWHGFGRKAQNASQILAVSDRGFLSFGARLTSDSGLQEVFSALPLDRVFLETDTADHESIFDIYRTAAQLKNVTIEQLKDQILHNFIIWLGKRELPYCLGQII